MFEFSLSFYEVEQVYWVYDKTQLIKQNYPERQVKALLMTDLIYPIFGKNVMNWVSNWVTQNSKDTV